MDAPYLAKCLNDSVWLPSSTVCISSDISESKFHSIIKYFTGEWVVKCKYRMANGCNLSYTQLDENHVKGICNAKVVHTYVQGICTVSHCVTQLVTCHEYCEVAVEKYKQLDLCESDGVHYFVQLGAVWTSSSLTNARYTDCKYFLRAEIRVDHRAYHIIMTDLAERERVLGLCMSRLDCIFSTT